MNPDLESVRRQYGPVVWSVAMRITNRHADAVDCYQEVFLELIRSDNTAKIESWEAYLRWLTTRRAIDSVRRRRKDESRREPSDLRSLSDEPTDDRPTEFQDLVDRVREELRNIPEAQAQAFWLVCVEQCSHAEVATQMSIQPNHVGVLVHRARKHLRSKLEHLVPNQHSSVATDEK